MNVIEVPDAEIIISIHHDAVVTVGERVVIVARTANKTRISDEFDQVSGELYRVKDQSRTRDEESIDELIDEVGVARSEDAMVAVAEIVSIDDTMGVVLAEIIGPQRYKVAMVRNSHHDAVAPKSLN